MTNDTEDMREGSQHRGTGRSSRGPLHDLLSAGLPQFIEPGDQVCNLHKLAKALSISYQAIYRWFAVDGTNRIGMRRIDQVIKLSEEYGKKHKGFKPLKREDFWQFISSY